MKTLDLHQAAELLHVHPATLYAKARSGEVPAAKPGRSWVFIDADLLDWIRGQYIRPGQDASDKTEKETCSLKDQKAITGITNLPSREKQYTDLLVPATKGRRKK